MTTRQPASKALEPAALRDIICTICTSKIEWQYIVSSEAFIPRVHRFFSSLFFLFPAPRASLWAAATSPSAVRSVWALRKHVAKGRSVLILVDMVNPYVPSSTIKIRPIRFVSTNEISYLCRLSGLGYLCSRSGQNGHTYPGESWTRP